MTDIARQVRAAASPVRPPFPLKAIIAILLAVALYFGWTVARRPLEFAITRHGIMTYHTVTPEAIRRMLSFGPKGINTLLEACYTLTTSEKAIIIEALAHAQGESVDSFLLANLKDESPVIRLNAILACQQRKLHAAAAPLRGMITTDATCGELARMALFEIGGPEAAQEAETLINMPLPQDPAEQLNFITHFFAAVPVMHAAYPDKLSERLCALALYGFGDEKTEPQEPDFLEELPENEATIRLRSLQTIRQKKIADPKTIKTLERIYLEPRRLYLRKAAAQALRTIGAKTPSLKTYQAEKLMEKRRELRDKHDIKTAGTTPTTNDGSPAPVAAPTK